MSSESLRRAIAILLSASGKNIVAQKIAQIIEIRAHARKNPRRQFIGLPPVNPAGKV
jgi:hypothetical protein